MLRNEEDALDAAQDVFVKLIHHQSRLYNQFPSSLLYTIATNTCLNRLRRQKTQGAKTLETASPAHCDPEYERVETDMLMDAILSGESESTRAICYMYHRDNMTLREIGGLMGLSVSGVQKRLSSLRSRAKIKWEGEQL